jgi:hypothetical protein
MTRYHYAEVRMNGPRKHASATDMIIRFDNAERRDSFVRVYNEAGNPDATEAFARVIAPSAAKKVYEVERIYASVDTPAPGNPFVTAFRRDRNELRRKH